MKTKDIQTLALAIYESDDCSAAFKRAWELFPDYNDGGEDTDKAEEYIRDQLQPLIPENLSQTDQDELANELSEMIYAGLT